MHEVNINKIESNSERDRLGQYVPNYRNLRGRDIYVQVDEFDMPIKGTHRIPPLPMPEYTAPKLEREKVQYDFDFDFKTRLQPKKGPKPEPKPIQVRPPEKVEFFKLEEIKIKQPDVRSLSEEKKANLLNLYAGGFSYNEIGKMLHIKRGQVAAFINSNQIQKQITPKLSLQMVERIREMWLKGWLPQTISEKLGYNYHCCVEWCLMYAEELASEPHTKGIANIWVVRIKKMRSMGATATEIVYRLKIPMLWVKRILE